MKHMCPAPHTRSPYDRLIDVGALAFTEQGVWDPKWNSYSMEYFYYKEEEIVPGKFLQFFTEEGNTTSHGGTI